MVGGPVFLTQLEEHIFPAIAQNIKELPGSFYMFFRNVKKTKQKSNLQNTVQ